ncbi:CP2 transcription factor [Trichophyton equinum CBS 127.97]|uniref:CP2 transcription factor n=1 Tax=Trichophyton equinum (strain ATCC MYA-4606 / CBS 127.97) TaxID=559882 RepID=F2PP86_TRIEC|nr:CP2 transcription factor [Trichophyton equinum CBS 127.97]
MLRSRRSSQKPDEALYTHFRQKYPNASANFKAGDSKNSKAFIPSPSLKQLPCQRPDGSNLYNPALKVQLDQLALTQPLVYPDDVPFSTFTNISPSCNPCKTPEEVLTDKNRSIELLTQPVTFDAVDSNTIPCTSSMDQSLLSHSAVDSTAALPQMPMSFETGLSAGEIEQRSINAPATLLHGMPDLGTLSNIPNVTDGSHLGRDAAGVTVNGHRESAGSPRNSDFGDDFRFHSTLHAVTAMVQGPDDIPITYLNKGQIYTLTVSDAGASDFGHYPTKYRTTVRITFDDEKQRLKPASYWKLWQEGRGANRAYQSESTLLAVEYVPHNQGEDLQPRYRQVQLEHNSLDGFSVVWTPHKINNRRDCAIYVRFNFVSTSFSYSKGVKGVPLRLCAKTEAISSSHELPGASSYSEISYCKVKLFRDHGAERKLSNDLIHVKKLIQQVKEQISEATLGTSNGGKRKRCNGSGLLTGNESTIKTRKCSKIPWSYGQDLAMKGPFEDDLRMELKRLTDKTMSRREVSILNLRGEPQDDLDLFPLEMDIRRTTADALGPDAETESKASLKDPKYCFYVQRRQNNKGNEGYFHAIYIQQLTAKAFTDALVKKWKFKSTGKVHTLLIHEDGLSVVADDLAVQALPEGKGVLFDFLEVHEEPLDVNMDFDSDTAQEL